MNQQTSTDNKHIDHFRKGAVQTGDMTGLNEVDCRISISGSQLVSGGNTREGWRRPAGELRRGEERGVWWRWCGRAEGGFAAMTTDGGGSKQMSTSWQTGLEWSSHWETGGDPGTQWDCRVTVKPSWALHIERQRCSLLSYIISQYICHIKNETILLWWSKTVALWHLIKSLCCAETQCDSIWHCPPHQSHTWYF